MPQSFSVTDTAVIQRARRKRREVIVLREDADWLRQYTTSPKDMLRRMARRGALIPIGAGRYAIPQIGSASPDLKAWQPMLHARLAPLGDYYLAGLSALIEHRLTDVSQRAGFVIVGFWHSALADDKVTVAGRQLRAAVTRRRVFDDEQGIETVRVSRSETYRRSDPNRTLVDCLWHPELCGPVETWTTAWGRANAGHLDPERTCRFALALGPSTSARVGLLLELLGHGSVAHKLLGRPIRADRAAMLVPRGPQADARTERDTTWNILFNVPRDRVEGWLSYGK